MDEIFNTARQSHFDAWAEAKETMPALDVNEIIQLIVSVYQSNDRAKAAMDAAKILAEKYKEPAEKYFNAFSVSFIENGLKKLKNEKFAELGTEEFARQIMDTTKDVAKTVEAFCHGELDVPGLITELSQTDILQVGQSFIQAAGVNIAEVKEQVQAALGDVSGQSVLMISFAASAAAYKMLREALHDAAVMREYRVRIEAECNESIAMMREYREQMARTVSEYMFIRADTFNKGVAAMDQAILDGDINGFIRGNTMIQDILDYKVQFRNQDEFDALMDSEEAFKL